MKPITIKINKYVLCFLLLSIQTVSYGGWFNLFKNRASSTSMKNTNAIGMDPIEPSLQYSVENLVMYENPSHESLFDYPEDPLLEPRRSLPLSEADAFSLFMKNHHPQKKKHYPITNDHEAFVFILDALAVERNISLYDNTKLEALINYILGMSVTYSENLSYAQFLFQFLHWRNPAYYTYSSRLANKIKNQTIAMHSVESMIFYSYKAIYNQIRLNFLALVQQAELTFPKNIFCGQDIFLY